MNNSRTRPAASPPLQSRIQEVHRNHRQHKQSDQQLPRTPVREYLLQPRPDQPLHRHIHQNKQQAGNYHHRQKLHPPHRRCHQHRGNPAQRRHCRKIGKSVAQSKNVKRAQAQRKAQQIPKLKICPKPCNQDGNHLPPQKYRRVKQRHPAGPSRGQKKINARVKRHAQAHHHHCAAHRGQNHADQIPPVVLALQVVFQHIPAQSGDQLQLLCHARHLDHVSHVSSSSRACSPPLCPTIERNICSSVFFSPSCPGMPARNSSSVPCATNRP